MKRKNKKFQKTGASQQQSFLSYLLFDQFRRVTNWGRNFHDVRVHQRRIATWIYSPPVHGERKTQKILRKSEGRVFMRVLWAKQKWKKIKVERERERESEIDLEFRNEYLGSGGGSIDRLITELEWNVSAEGNQLLVSQTQPLKFKGASANLLPRKFLFGEREKERREKTRRRH